MSLMVLISLLEQCHNMMPPESPLGLYITTPRTNIAFATGGIHTYGIAHKSIAARGRSCICMCICTDKFSFAFLSLCKLTDLTIHLVDRCTKKYDPFAITSIRIHNGFLNKSTEFLNKSLIKRYSHSLGTFYLTSREYEWNKK